MTFNKMHLIRQVDLFTLRLFLSAVEEQQIGRAAIRENIAASTATKRIQDLEEIAGVKLLERTPKGVVPSPAGEVLVRYLRTIFGQLDDMRAEISAFTEGVRGEVHIASARSIIAPFLARELGSFSRDFPLVELVLSEVENAEIVRTVAHGEADIGVFAMAHEIDLSGVDVVPYRKDRMVVVVPHGHQLADRGSVSFEDLLQESIIAVNAMMPVFRNAARRLKEEFKPRFTVRSAGVAISLVQAGFGVTVQPECLVSRDMFDSVSVLDLAEPWANRAISIATPHGRLPGPAARILLEYLVERPAVH
jgi:DNA-binding transcriptional LysR family regulator